MARHCQIFVNTNLETLALRINVECTLNCVKSCVERQTGLSSAGQKFMSGQRKVLENIPLQSQGIEDGSVLHLLLPLLGGGDRNGKTLGIYMSGGPARPNNLSFLDRLEQTQDTRYSASQSPRSDLLVALRAIFPDPAVCNNYTRKLEENHLTSVDSLQDLEADDLVGIGLTKLDAGRLLRQCAVMPAIVCVGDYSNQVGVIRLARYMKLSDARRISYEGRLPLPAAFRFVCGSTQMALTEQQEATWDAHSTIHRHSLLVRETTTLSRDKWVAQTEENREIPSANCSLFVSAEVPSTETSGGDNEVADLESGKSYEKKNESSGMAKAAGSVPYDLNRPGLPGGLMSDTLEEQCENDHESHTAREFEPAAESRVGYRDVASEETKNGPSTDGLTTASPAPVPGVQQKSICLATATQQSVLPSGEENTEVNASPQRHSRKRRRRRRNNSSSSSSTSGTCHGECKAIGSQEGASTTLVKGTSPLDSIETTSQPKEEEEDGKVVDMSSKAMAELQVGQEDASYKRPFDVAEVEPLATSESVLEYQQTRGLSDLGQNMQTSLLGIEVDARIAECNPFSALSAQEVEVSWLYVQTRRKKKRFVLFEVHMKRPDGEVQVQLGPRMKSLRRFLKDYLHVKGTGGLSLVRRCELFQSMGPFEVLQVDPTVRVIIDSVVLPNQRKLVYKIRFDKSSVRSIYSLKLGDWLQERAAVIVALDYPLRSTVEDNEGSTKVLAGPRTERPLRLRKPKASFRQFRTCTVRAATHIIVDEDGHQHPIQVTSTDVENLHKALHGYKQKSIPFCCHEIMTPDNTLLVQRFVDVNPASSGILPRVQQVVSDGQKNSKVSIECIVCRFGDRSFHSYWPCIRVSCSDGQEIRSQTVQKLLDEYPDRRWDTVVDKSVYDCQSLPIVGSTLPGSVPFAFVGLFGADGSLLKSAQDLDDDFLSFLSLTCLRQGKEEDCPNAGNPRDNPLSTSHVPARVDDIQGQWRPFGRHGAMWKYVKGSILPPEGQDREYKSLNRCPRQKIAFKIIHHSVKFICGCLNIRKQSAISFGIGDKFEQQGKFRHGEVIGLAVEKIQDEIQQLYQYMLDNMICRDNKCGMTPSEQLSVSIHFVRVTPCLNENPHIVVEVEVDPQWSICKDYVYIYKQFEKKERSKNLKEVPDNWHHSHDYRLSRDYTPTLRKAGMTSEIDWPGFMSHKKAIEDRYKEYQRSIESTYNSVQVDVDLSELCAKLQRSLRKLDCDRYQYILVANAVPGHTRDNEYFAFFSKVPWIAVVDFDPSSENGGLQDMFTKKAANGPLVRRQLRVMDATYDRKEESHERGESRYRPSSLLSWIFANGRQNVSQTYHTYSDWVGYCKKGTEDALLAHIRVAMSPIVVFALFSTSSLQEMAALVQYTYSVMVAARAKRNIVVLSDDLGDARKLTEFAGVDVRECCVAGLPWDHVKINFEQMLPELAEEFPEKYLTSSTGTEIPVPAQRVSSWDELDVISSRECEQTDFQPDVIERTKLNFYKGEQAEWLNFYCNHDIERCIAPSLRKSLLSKIDALRSPNFANERGYRTPVRLLTVYHYPGTGGTTLCRRLLWDLRKQFRCALVKSVADTTARQVQRLYEFGEIQTPSSSILPVILMVDSVIEHQLETFCSSLNRARLKVVIIHCKSSPTEVQRRPIDEDLYYCLDRKLQPKELNRATDIVLGLEKEPEKRIRYITNIKRDKQIFYFGLQLFGQEYNQKRLATFVKSHLDNICELEVQILKFCSLVYSFRHTAVPRACIRDLLVPGLGEYSSIHVEDFSETTADLLVSSEENIDNFVFVGYRPAHHLVGVEILNNYLLYDTTHQFLEKMLRPSSTYARSIIEDVAIRMFTRRDGRQEFDDDEEEAPGLDAKTSPDRAVAQKVRENRFPRLVMDILTEEGVFRTLDLLLLLWRRSSVSPQRAYLWQHIARFLAHEIGFTELPPAQTRELLCLLSESASNRPDSEAGNDFGKVTISYGTLPLLADSSVHLSGFDAALKTIDRAIEMIPDRSIFHGTRGTVFKLQLAAYRSKHCSAQELSNPIKLTQLSCDAFIVSRNCVQKFQSWYPQVGESEVCIEFLRIVKEMDLFQKYLTPTDRKVAFRALLEGRTVPRELSSLSREQLIFIQTREQRIRSNLDEIFECEDLSRGWEKGQRYEYQRTKMKGAFLRRSFIEVSDSYSVSLSMNSKGWESSPELRRQMVEEMLYNAAEHPYSSWMNFEEKNFRRVVDLLRPLCLVDYGQLSSQSDTTILMFVRACIEMRGDRSVSVNELVMVINNWCRAKPQNAWAHLFQYMVYFPLPNLPSTNDKDLVNAAIRCCQTTIMNRHHVPRRSKPKYFVGKGEGLDILVPAHKVSIHYFDATTQYWRSKGVMTKLARLKGTKLRLGRILFNGIEISFDNDRFPGESKDWLWFYLGFTIQGPYAYDPVDANEYEELKAIDPATLPDLPLELFSQSGSHGFRPDSSGTSVSRTSTSRWTAKEAVSTDETVTESGQESLQCVSPRGPLREPAPPALDRRVHVTQAKKHTDLPKRTSARDKVQPTSRSKLSQTEIRITGLNATIKDKDLRRKFEHFGKVKRFHRKSLDLAFVEFEDKQSASRAVKGRRLELQGYMLSVKRAYSDSTSVSHANQSSPTLTAKEKPFTQSDSVRIEGRDSTGTMASADHPCEATPIATNQESTDNVSVDPTLQGPTLIINNLPGPPESDLLFDLFRAFDENVFIIRLSETTAQAQFDSLENAEAAQRQISSYVNKTSGRSLATRMVNTGAALSRSVEDSGATGDTKIESFQERLATETRDIQVFHCLNLAAVIAPLVTDGPLLQTLASYVMSQGCRNPVVIAKLCSCLIERKISVPVPGGHKRQKVTFKRVLTDMCESEFSSSIGDSSSESTSLNSVTKFIAELYVVKAVNFDFVDRIMATLVSAGASYKVECLCVIFDIAGKTLDKEKRSRVDELFKSVNKVIARGKIDRETVDGFRQLQHRRRSGWPVSS